MEEDWANAAGLRVWKRRHVAEATARSGSPAASTEAMGRRRRRDDAWISPPRGAGDGAEGFGREVRLGKTLGLEIGRAHV